MFMQQVRLPGVCVRSFTALLEYLYTGEFVTSLQDEWFELIELGDRMCLLALVARAEQCVVDDLMRKQDGGCDVTEEVLDIVELAQVHDVQAVTVCFGIY